jgi:hypothetical protein
MSESLSDRSVLGDPMEAWKARGRELNAIYDTLAEVVCECAPGFDPVADVKALGAERDRLRVALEEIADARRWLSLGKTPGEIAREALNGGTDA